MKKKFIKIFALIFFIPSVAIANTYYLRTDGKAQSASYAKGPCNVQSSTMNLTVHNYSKFLPGDVIKVCDDGGSYDSTAFIPPSSGAKDTYITYEAATGDSPSFRNQHYGVDLSKGQDSLKFIGLKFEHVGKTWTSLGYNGNPRNDYIWFDKCTFYDAHSYAGFLIEDSDFGKITNCNFPDAPRTKYCTYWDTMCEDAFNAKQILPDDCNCESAPADILQVSLHGSNAHYWVIEGNTFGKSSHASINMHDGIKYSVIRKNIFKNKWHANIGACDLYNTSYDRSFTLVENNVVNGGGMEKTTNPSKRDRTQINGQGLGIAGNYMIVRNNEVSNSDYGLALLGYSESHTNENRIYNNTFYNNYMSSFQTGNSTADLIGNVIKNNIFYRNNNYIPRQIANSALADRHSIWFNCADYSSATTNLFVNNAFPADDDTFYFKNTRNTKRTLEQVILKYSKEWKSNNISISNPLFSDKNFLLESQSPLIDAGEWLTTITSKSGKVYEFTVEDPNYFYDGWGIPGEHGDQIKTQSGEISTIQKVNYSSGSITVNPPIVVSQNEGISISFYGNALDIGANEWGGLSAPKLTIMGSKKE